MTNTTNLTQITRAQSLLKTGAAIGIAGGLAEIAVVWLHAAWTGGSADLVARQVSVAARLGNGSALAGVAVHMTLALALGLVLATIWQRLARTAGRDAWLFPLMLGSLATVWGVNFFVVLPVVSPAFVHLLPLTVTLASKLAFGLSGAVALRLLADSGALAIAAPAAALSV